jgi:hypothetical protein
LEGFINYYETPYLFYGNEVAKEKVNLSFKKRGNNISPNYLMVELFNYLNWPGNKYMQLISDFKKTISVYNNNYYYSNQEWKKGLSKKELKVYNKYLNYNYYFIN